MSQKSYVDEADITPAWQAENLRGLLWVLYEAKEAQRHFHLSDWGLHPVADHAPSLCGATACAYGFAALNTILQARGLNPDWSTEANSDNELMMAPFLRIRCFEKDYIRIPSFDGIQRFFGLDEERSDYLFSRYRYEKEDWTRINAVIGRFKMHLDMNGLL